MFVNFCNFTSLLSIHFNLICTFICVSVAVVLKSLKMIQDNKFNQFFVCVLIYIVYTYADAYINIHISLFLKGFLEIDFFPPLNYLRYNCFFSINVTLFFVQQRPLQSRTPSLQCSCMKT